jgi:hypothetical protein
LRSKLASGFDQASDLRARVNVRRPAPFAGAEVIARGQLVLHVFDVDMAREATHSFQPSVALRN